MPKAYVVTSSISDPEKFAAYAKLAPAAVAPFGASFLARGNAAAAYENGRKERIVIVEYPSSGERGPRECRLRGSAEGARR